MEIREQFEKWRAELVVDTRLDDLNLKEAAQRLPAIKHKWVGRLMEQKHQLGKLNKLKKQKSAKLIDEVKSKTSVEMSDAALLRKVQGLPDIENVDDAIDDTEQLILYLEKVEKIFQGMSFDIKNVIEIQKLETL